MGSGNPHFLTLTLLNHDLIDAWPSWCSLELSLKEIWLAVVKWGTHGIKPYSNIQEYLALKEFADNSGPEDVFKKNEITEVYSYIRHLNTPATEIDPSTLGGTTCVVQLMTQNNKTAALWKRLSALDYISTINDFRLILADRSILSMRFFDGETYGAIQLICHSKYKSSFYLK